MTERVAIITSPSEGKGLDELVPSDVLDAARCDIQKAIPALAKDLSMVQSIERAIKRVPTKHQLILGDSRGMESIADESVHLVVTSPPYWNLKKYPDRNGQLGQIDDYEEFLDNLDQVWRHVLRVLVPGGEDCGGGRRCMFAPAPIRQTCRLPPSCQHTRALSKDRLRQPGADYLA